MKEDKQKFEKQNKPKNTEKNTEIRLSLPSQSLSVFIQTEMNGSQVLQN